MATEAVISVIYVGKHMCSFCKDGKHELCPRVIKNGGQNGPHLLRCPCTAEGAVCQDLRCRICKMLGEDEVDPKTWMCYDRNACGARVQKRLDANPLVRRIMESKERAMADKAAKATETKAKAAPKEGKCIVTGQKTKGGKFAPGMDARYVSNQVAAVISGEKSKTAALKEFKEHDLSETLIGKFEKNLGLAQEREEKRKAAEKAKADAKKEKAKAKA